MLCENPKIAERLHKEIVDTVDGTNRPTYDNIRDMKYLRAFINGEYLIFGLTRQTGLTISLWKYRGFEALPCSVRFIHYKFTEES